MSENSSKAASAAPAAAVDVKAVLKRSESDEKASDDQVEQLRGHLKTIMAKQEELKKAIAMKHSKAESARRLSTQGEGSLRNLMVERHDEKHSIDVLKTPGIAKRLQDYTHDVEELEKEYEETSKLVNEVASVLALMNA